METETPMPRDRTADAIRAPGWLQSFVDGIETNERLDALVDPYERATEPLGREPVAGILQGRWLGHALHPLLTDLPLGCWIAAGLLDLVGGRASRPAAQRLVGLGLTAVPITAASGASDWRLIEDRATRRAGVAHAAGNAVVGFCYLQSWRQRRRGRHARGVAWGLAGGGLAWVTGYVGGHLSFGRGVGVGERGLHTPTEVRQPPLVDEDVVEEDIEVTAADVPVPDPMI